MELVISDQAHSSAAGTDQGRILSSVAAFALLREELIKNIGMERMKGFLLRYAYELGANAGRNALSLGYSTFEEVLRQGPDFHSNYGHTKAVIYHIDAKMDQNKKIVTCCGRGSWVGSFEGLEHLKRFGRSESPICYTLTGYVSGFMSTITNLTIIARETSCIAMGDSVCRWEFRTLEEWGSEIEEEYRYYGESPIIKDFEYTYEQLLEQRNYIYQVANIHKKLTEAVADGSDLQTIADITYEIAGIPIIIDDVGFQTFVYSGMTEERFIALNDDMEQYIKQSQKKNEAPVGNRYELFPSLSKRLIQINDHYRLIAPITVKRKILGYCTFIYDSNDRKSIDDDFLLLERVANAASLCMLNEKTSFESFERMKGNFLEQLLNQQYSSRAEILKRGRYLNIDLGQKFYVGELGIEYRQISMDEELVLHEKLLETAISYFNERKTPVLVGQRHRKIVLLVPSASLQGTPVAAWAESFMSFLESKYAQCKFKMGISSEGSQIERAAQHYEEAVIAGRMLSKKRLLLFESLGIVGMLINSQNVKAIKMLAEQYLGPLHGKCGNDKHAELVKTLYVFLLNGGKLEQTMKDLNLSMTGLLYRIQKIETMIGKDLRNPTDSHHIFLILESLVALGELEIK